MPADPNEIRYSVAIPYFRLRQPPDVSHLTAVNPELTVTLRGDVTVDEFAALCDHDLRFYLSLPTEGPDDWTIHVGPEEASAYENSRSPQERCMIAWLNHNRPGQNWHNEQTTQLARDWREMPLPALWALMLTYLTWHCPFEGPDDQWCLDHMTEYGISYTDIAELPA